MNSFLEQKIGVKYCDFYTPEGSHMESPSVSLCVRADICTLWAIIVHENCC